MSDNIKPFNILVAEEYTTSNGEVKTQWHRVGTAFQNSKGGFNLELVPGLALTGRAVILPKPAEKAPAAAEAVEDDGIPY